MARTDSARALGPALFDRDWSRVSGSWQGLARNAQMVRAARGYSPAIFKPISKGGCHTGAQLRAQLTYLTTKSSHILDSRGTHEGKKTLTEAEIERVARRFENQWGERHSPKLGHTSHLLMAFPIGTKGEEARDITQAVCERFFQGKGSQFDYIAAIHQDRAHPHAHIVLNRRSKDGEMFFLGRDHHFNYDAFRAAMVEAAKVHGIRLEATRRLDRGIVTYRAEIEEIYKAREEGRPPVERQRTGADLDAALQTVARNALAYWGLAAEASRSNFDDVAEALEQASTILASGGKIQSDGVLYMSDDDTAFDTLITEFSQNIRQIEAAIDTAPAAERPVIERKLTDVLASVAHLNPLGDRSVALIDAASRDGIYARPNASEDHIARLDTEEVRTKVAEALQGTGIDPDAVAARLREGAGNAALERQWLAQDLRAIAKAGDLDLEKVEDREEALDRLEAVHVRLGDVLTGAQVLRETEGDEQDDDAFRGDGIEARAATPADPALRLDPVSLVLHRAREDDGRSPALRDEGEGSAFRAAIDARLGADGIARLKSGDEGALEELAETKLDRLILAKTYLESSEVTAHGPAMERVLDALAEEQIDVQRLRHAEGHGDKGITHG